MTRTFTRNGNNDIYIANDGRLAISTGLEAVKEACETASYALLAEMIYSQNRGLPYFQTIWTGAPNVAIFRRYLINTLLAIDGVTDVQSVTAQVQNNTLKYTAEIVTIYGATVISNG